MKKSKSKVIVDFDPDVSEQGFRKNVFFPREFTSELKDFQEFIKLDADIDAAGLKNNNARFSVAIRELIKWYNGVQRKRRLKNAQTN